MDSVYSKPQTIIGIGASAGGLKALQAFVSGLQPCEHCCFLVAQHLSANHTSNMVGLLAKYSAIPVVTATDGTLLAANTIYVCPENTNMSIDDGCIRLTNPESDQHAIPSINVLFQSLATEFQDKAVGVILTGVGSDGAEGLNCIKANRGITVVQDPQSAQYDGMVKASLTATEIDHISSPQKIGKLLSSITCE